MSDEAANRGGSTTGLNVAIIIVTYKSALLTIACLRSIQAELTSPGLNIRAIVIDNASGDFESVTDAIQANEWSSWASCVLAPRNGGFAYGNDLVMQLALDAGPVSYFYLLNPDTELRTGAIGTLIRFMELNPAVGIPGGNFETQDGSDRRMAFRFPSLTSEFLAGIEFGLLSRLFASSVVPRDMTPRAQPTDWICGGAMTVRASVVSATGGFDENYFLYFEDTNFCRHALRAGFLMWYVPPSRVTHIMGQSSNVTGVAEGFRRMSNYWFELRRRYFVVNFGVRKAMLIGCVARVSLWPGMIKKALMGRLAGWKNPGAGIADALNQWQVETSVGFCNMYAVRQLSGSESLYA